MAAKKSVLTLLTGLGLLAATACTSSPTGGDAAPGAAHLTTTTTAGDADLSKVTWALPYGEPTTLDPAKIGDYSPQTVEANLCDTLTRMNADFSLGPGLAQKVTWADEHTLVLDLRSDVTFWDGSPMTPQDVVYSLERQRDPKTQALYGNYLAAVTAITATGPHQVTLATRSYDRTLPKALSTSFGAVNQRAYTEKAGAAYGTAKGGLMCTGPFKLGSWESGSGITLERNTAYWDAALKPKAHQVLFRFITNSNTLTGALLSGEVDGTYELPPSSATALARTGNGAIHLGPSTQNVLLIPANADSPATDHRRLDALSRVIDREALIRNVFGGDATPLKSLVPPGHLGRRPGRRHLRRRLPGPARRPRPGHRQGQGARPAGRPAHPPADRRHPGGRPALAPGDDLHPGRGQEDRHRHRDQAAAAHRDVLAVLRPVRPQEPRPGAHLRLRHHARPGLVRRRDGHPARHLQLDRLRRRRGDPPARPGPHRHRPDRLRHRVRRCPGAVHPPPRRRSTWPPRTSGCS
ncbi:hypothetical protein GCM10023235_04280 [Kitasatospora terrestris]|uniref:Solute-binding protein family 5 domain-containing protein n=1 Tax=Kitasatospora terrestris TaxID=258051 RepID=A0ABP9D7T0_9ACTN